MINLNGIDRFKNYLKEKEKLNDEFVLEILDNIKNHIVKDISNIEISYFAQNYQYLVFLNKPNLILILIEQSLL